MKFGKIRIEDQNLIFIRHMMPNTLPCKDILWAYLRRESVAGGNGKQLLGNRLVIHTRRKKHYRFEMPEKEARECIRVLKALNPEMATGFPRGGRIPLQSLPNTRDMGALMSQDGRHIQPKRLLRSGDLYHVSQADQSILAQDYRLKTVVDFRTGTERANKPDTIFPGVEYYHIPVIDEETMGISREGGMEQLLAGFGGDAHSYMLRQYENMIRDRFSMRQYARFLDVLLRQENGAVLWHCSAGKDRAGVGTALLLCVLGIPMEIIREDFLRTNLFLEKEREYMQRLLESQGMLNDRVLENLGIFYQVKIEYLDMVFHVIEEDYGSVDRFLKRALYLTPKAIESLRDKYLI